MCKLSTCVHKRISVTCPTQKLADVAVQQRQEQLPVVRQLANSCPCSGSASILILCAVPQLPQQITLAISDVKAVSDVFESNAFEAYHGVKCMLQHTAQAAVLDSFRKLCLLEDTVHIVRLAVFF